MSYATIHSRSLSPPKITLARYCAHMTYNKSALNRKHQASILYAPEDGYFE